MAASTTATTKPAATSRGTRKRGGKTSKAADPGRAARRSAVLENLREHAARNRQPQRSQPATTAPTVPVEVTEPRQLALW